MKPTIEECILSEHNVEEALSRLGNSMIGLEVAGGQEKLESIGEDYRLMCESYENGMRDPHGTEMYRSLLRRLYGLYNSVRLASLVKSRHSYSVCKKVSDGVQLHGGDVMFCLEEFVQDVAFASLDFETGQSAARTLYAKHQRYMDSLFCAILVSGQWSGNEKDRYADMLVSPTIDHNDALLIVSAITMSLMAVFDVNKWLVLTILYKKGTSEYLRQRALVGLALTLPSDDLSIFPEIDDSLSELCQSETVRNQLLELQLQLLYCVRTESENKEIQRDILPTLIKNNNLDVTQNGIVEKDDDPLGNLLDDDSTDKKISELEDTINKMAEMQKNGSDIYFGGFSQMKRFSFFYQLSNWFLPFYAEQPDIVSSVKGDALNVLDSIVGNGPFCDSDKYSFVFALSSIYSRLPDGVKEMLSSGMPSGALSDADVDRNSPSYIRRMYLQDLYRFFMLYKDKKDFDNPFVSETENGCIRILFMKSQIFSKHLSWEMEKIDKFCFAHGLYKYVVRISEDRYKQNIASDAEVSLLAFSYLRLRQLELAKTTFRSVNEKKQDDANVVKGLALTLFELGEYEDASRVYSRLVSIDGGTKYSLLRYGLSLVNAGSVKEGLSVLFKLNFEDSEDLNVKRALAWGLLMDCRPQESEPFYDEIVASGSCVPSDYLNAGYSKWLQMKNREACMLFETYAKLDGCSILDSFRKDEAMLSKYDIKDYERQLMVCLVDRSR